MQRQGPKQSGSQARRVLIIGLALHVSNYVVKKCGQTLLLSPKGVLEGNSGSQARHPGADLDQPPERGSMESVAVPQRAVQVVPPICPQSRPGWQWQPAGVLTSLPQTALTTRGRCPFHGSLWRPLTKRLLCSLRLHAPALPPSPFLIRGEGRGGSVEAEATGTPCQPAAEGTNASGPHGGAGPALSTWPGVLEPHLGKAP